VLFKLLAWVGGARRSRGVGVLTLVCRWCWGSSQSPEDTECTITHFIIKHNILAPQKNWVRHSATFGYTGCSVTSCRVSLCRTQNGQNATQWQRVAVNQNTGLHLDSHP